MKTMENDSLYITDISYEGEPDCLSVDLTDDSYDLINIESNGTTNTSANEGMD